jgi:hypothetical protein
MLPDPWPVRGEQQIVPGDIDPSVELQSLVFAVHETLYETPALIYQELQR